MGILYASIVNEINQELKQPETDRKMNFQSENCFVSFVNIYVVHNFECKLIVSLIISKNKLFFLIFFNFLFVFSDSSKIGFDVVIKANPIFSVQ